MNYSTEICNMYIINNLEHYSSYLAVNQSYKKIDKLIYNYCYIKIYYENDVVDF